MKISGSLDGSQRQMNSHTGTIIHLHWWAILYETTCAGFFWYIKHVDRNRDCIIPWGIILPKLHISLVYVSIDWHIYISCFTDWNKTVSHTVSLEDWNTAYIKLNIWIWECSHCAEQIINIESEQLTIY